ncbi:DNA translocase FtsK [Fictibacillus gelatini]|uniref:DNA translocase FtsK n=1 Tax=Fictibacillus gelatini TaxID=225985 RepID=UPI000412359A|nr:DNA translocase FtsK [Fictibacillus gelatini]
MPWYKKLMNLLFGDEPSEPDERDQAIHKVMKVKPNQPRVTRSIGRIQNQEKQAKAKMVHHYPNGNFRFPLIPDEKRIPYRPEPLEKKYEAPEKKESKIEHKETKKYSGTNFKPTEIPSPVYGFGNRNLKRVEDSKELANDLSSETKKRRALSPVYGFRPRENGIQSTNDVKTSLEETTLDELNKDREQFEGLLFEAEPADERNVFDETTGGDEERVEEINNKKEDGISVTKDEIPEAVKMARVESEPHAEEIQQDLSKKEKVVSGQNILPLAKRMEEENNGANVMHSGEMKKSAVNNETKEESSLIAKKEEKRDQPKRGGTNIPFNVMMLKKDRQIQKQKQTGEEITVPFKKMSEREVPKGHFPSLELLNVPPKQAEDDAIWLEEQRELLQLTLDNFNVNAKVVHLTKGPSVTRMEVQPAPGVKVNKITNLSDDIKLSLSAKDIRIEAPIPGKNTIGIEVPNRISQPVFLREIIQSEEFRRSDSPLTVALGLDISGKPIVTDLQKMPHGLIAGATGSGKSVCINSILVSLMYKASPDDVRLLLIDPKIVELAPYNQIPHLVTPVITDAKEATMALKWAVEEMERRYEEFAKTGVRDIKRYNEKMKAEKHEANKMPFIVVVIDELADLMMVSPHDVEEAICRIAQKARACGIHLLLATQRPSVDVITGLIKANIPTRVAFAVSSAVDSRTIIDMSGAERLLGRGDMLFMENGSNKAVRIQGNFVSDEEIERVTEYVKKQTHVEYLFSREELIQTNQTVDQEDDLFEEACYYVLEMGTASSSSLQRRFRIGYNRAARLIDMMEAFGLVSEAMGSKPRNVLISQEEFENKLYSEMEV